MNTFATLPDEKEVLDRLKQSDEEAFAQIYNAYWKPLFYIAATRLKSMPEAEEVVQDVFLDIWNRREELAITNCLSSYLSACIRYRIINLLAKKDLRHRYRNVLQKQAPPVDSCTENTLAFEALKTELEKETSRLPHKCQLVFRLSREEGYSQKEIAATLQISEKTVEAHLSKALRLLRAGLSHIITVYLLILRG